MRKLLTAALLACAPLAALADATVSVTNVDPSVAEVTMPIAKNTVIAFGEIVTITTGDQSKTFFWPQINEIVFKTKWSGVSDITASARQALRLSENPVGDTLLIEGAPEGRSRLAVTSLSGQTLIVVNDWQGAAIDASSLTPGLYLLTVNNETIKFLKK